MTSNRLLRWINRLAAAFEIWANAYPGKCTHIVFWRAKRHRTDKTQRDFDSHLHWHNPVLDNSSAPQGVGSTRNPKKT